MNQDKRFFLVSTAGMIAAYATFIAMLFMTAYGLVLTDAVMTALLPPDTELMPLGRKLFVSILALGMPVCVLLELRDRVTRRLPRGGLRYFENGQDHTHLMRLTAWVFVAYVMIGTFLGVLFIGLFQVQYSRWHITLSLLAMWAVYSYCLWGVGKAAISGKPRPVYHEYTEPPVT